MNVKEYIESGIIESYVLGMATEAERKEFEQMCATYPEVAKAREAFERTLEETLMQEAQEPPPELKKTILAQVAPGITAEKELPQKTETPIRRLNVWKWVAAACLLLTAGMGYWAYTTNQKYQELTARQATVEKQLQESTAQLQMLQQDAEMLRKPMKMVALKGTDKAPQAQTTLFWDTTATKDVYLLINNLPAPPSNMQYQLWAILDKKPVDLGFFDYDVQQKRLLVRMKNVQNAQAFGITLEPRKKPDPSKPMGEMYVVGNL